MFGTMAGYLHSGIFHDLTCNFLARSHGKASILKLTLDIGVANIAALEEERWCIITNITQANLSPTFYSP